MRLLVRSLLLALLLLVPRAAFAQAQLLVHRPLSTGILLNPTSVATLESPFALALNPAGLSLGPGGLSYLHEEGDDTLPRARRGDAFFLDLGGLVAGDLSGGGLGFGMEWLRPLGGCNAANPCLRRTSLGYAAGTPAFSLGLSYHWYQSNESVGVDHLGTWDLGLIWRPARWISLGALGQAFNRPALRGGGHVPGLYTVGVGLRPLGPRLELGTDLQVDDSKGFGAIRFSHWAGLGVVEGFDLVAQLAYQAQAPAAGRDVVLQVGFRAGFGALQLAASGAALPYGPSGGWGQTTELNALAAKGPEILGPRRTAQVVDVTHALQREGGLARLLRGPEPLDPYTRLALRLQRLVDDRSVGALVLEVRGLGDLSLGRIEELRGLLQQARQRGKRVLIWLESGGDAEYYLATAADRVYAAPQALLLINGLASERIYLRGLLDKVGVTPEFVKIGRFKSAPEQFTNTQASESSAEESNALLDDEFARYLQAVADARKLPVEKVRQLLAQGAFISEQALEAGLIDGVSPSGRALEPAIEQLSGERLAREPAGPAEEAPLVWGSVPGIGLVEVSGSIVARGSDGGLSGEVAGAERIVRRLREAAEDPGVRAIVLRVESPGGDVGASELIWQAVSEARRKKPVIASFGDVAASGGYYVASAADYIVAEPSTITGSIGVFAGKADVSPLLAKLGVTTEVFKRGERADFYSFTRPWTEPERAYAQELVQRFYGTFLERVAAGRKLTTAQVDQVAQGRVWTGAQAKERGLVDELGGLQRALQIARTRAGLPEGSPVRVLGTTGLYELPNSPLRQPEAPAGRLAQLVMALSGVDPASLQAAGAVLPRGLRGLGPLLDALEEGRPMALAIDLPDVR